MSRRMLKLNLPLFVAGALAFAGCNLTSNDTIDTGDSEGGDDDTPPSEITIYDIQDKTARWHPEENTNITLKDKIVSAVIQPAAEGNGRHLYITEPAGGDYSGVYVYDQGRLVPEEIAIGDVVTIKAVYTEFRPDTAVRPDTVAEMTLCGTGACSIEITASGATVPMATVAAADIAQIDTDGSRAKALEGVLVQVDGAVTVGQILAHGIFTIKNDAGDEVQVDDQIWTDAEQGKAVTQVVTSIRGILHYAYEESSLLPRTPDDVVAEPVVAPPTTIYQIQDRSRADAIPVGGPVKIIGAVVTGVKAPGTGSFFIQTPESAYDATYGAAYSGIYVYRSPVDGNVAPAVGDIVTVEGTYAEYTGTGFTLALRQIAPISITITGAGAGTVPAAVVVADPASLATGGANADKYQGVLVRVEDVSITTKNPDAPNDDGQFAVTGNLRIDDFLYSDCEKTFRDRTDPFTYIQGIGYVYKGQNMIEPRDVNDVNTAPKPLPVATIYQIQDPAHPQHVVAATNYRVVDVVVTAVLGDGSGDFFVQTPAAAYDATRQETFSGMYVTRTADATKIVAVGDRVTVQGQAAEYPASGATKTQTRFTAASVDIAHDGVVPAPKVLTVATLTTAGEPDKYEGVLVKLANVGIATPNPDDPNDNGQFTVGDGVPPATVIDPALYVDDTLYANTATLGRLATAGFEFLSGVLNVDSNTFKLLPRGTSDIKANEIPPEPCSIYMIQKRDETNAIALHTNCQLLGPTTTDEKSVVVTAVVDPKGPFFVQVRTGSQDAALQAKYSGIYCDRSVSAENLALAPGMVVKVIGPYFETSKDNAGTTDETTVSSILVSRVSTFDDGSGGVLTDTVPAAAAATLAELTTAATAEPYEGVRVALPAVGLGEFNPDGATDNGEFTVTATDQPGATGGLRVDDLLFSTAEVTGRTAVGGFSAIGGIVHFEAAAFKLEPTAAGDMTAVTLTALPNSIYDIQDTASANHPAVNAGVRLENVVVSAAQGDGTGSFFVQLPAAVTGADARGTKFSGIYCVRQPSAGAAAVTAGSTTPAVAPSLVTLEGRYVELAGTGDGMSAIRVVSMTISAGTTPIAPTPIAQIANIKTGGTDAEAYEGVLLKLDEATTPALTVSVDEDEPDGQFRIGSGDVIPVDDLLFDGAEDIGRSASRLVNITGILYADTVAMVLLARSGTPDEMYGVHPIQKIRNRNAIYPNYPVPAQTKVRVEGAVVTALFVYNSSSNPTPSKGRFIVQIQKGGSTDAGWAKWGGIIVYRKCEDANTAVAVGDVVTIDGIYNEYQGMSQLGTGGNGGVNAAVLKTGTATVEFTTITDATTVKTGGADAEAYENVLLSFDSIGLENPNPDGASDFGEFTITGGYRVDDYLYDPTENVGRAATKGFNNIRGIQYYKNNDFKLEPREAGDITPTP